MSLWSSYMPSPVMETFESFKRMNKRQVKNSESTYENLVFTPGSEFRHCCPNCLYDVERAWYFNEQREPHRGGLKVLNN